MVSTRDTIKVTSLPTSNVNSPAKLDGGKPAHWQNTSGVGFQNPWPSYVHKSLWDAAKFLTGSLMGSNGRPNVPKDIDALIPSVRPTWGIVKSENEPRNEEKIKATWLGHACVLVELPVRPSEGPLQPSRGARILFDPVFSDRCSPTQWIGPKRYTKPPCEISDIPEVDAIVISHDHYDHLDAATISAFSKRPHAPHIFAGLGNTATLRSFGVADEKIHVLDWWEGRRVEVEVEPTSKEDSTNNPATAAATTVAFDLTCTPAQHQSGRNGFDRYSTLWASWVVQEVVPQSSPAENQEAKGAREGVKVYFAGDTGYRSVIPGKDEEQLPACPAFKEIGERFGGFDFAMIPIGAYAPRNFMSAFHCAPKDSVEIFKDVRAKKALGMHWGTWVLTVEPVTEPPRLLEEECRKAGIPKEDFDVCNLGETLFF